ncbi:hypothetical protein [Chamaesiphon minutus]|nr:hypothetical protein [Chamaesiphon minutus]
MTAIADNISQTQAGEPSSKGGKLQSAIINYQLLITDANTLV